MNPLEYLLRTNYLQQAETTTPPRNYYTLPAQGYPVSTSTAEVQTTETPEQPSMTYNITYNSPTTTPTTTTASTPHSGSGDNKPWDVGVGLGGVGTGSYNPTNTQHVTYNTPGAQQQLAGTWSQLYPSTFADLSQFT